MNTFLEPSIEKRRFPRLEQNLSAIIQHDIFGAKNSTCKNISEGGACLEVELDEIKENSLWIINFKEAKISIEISLVNGHEKIKALAIVRWNKEMQLTGIKRFNLGLEFVELDVSIKNRISAYIAENMPKKDIEDKAERVPHDAELNHKKEFVANRREWLSKKTGVKLSHVSYFSSETEDFKGNIENLIGVAQIPIGVVGPLLVRGDFASGVFYVPFATTEGAMVETYQRGAIAITKSGGVRVFINKDANRLDPIILFENSNEARNFAKWIQGNFLRIKEEAESTTNFGKLASITPYIVGRRVILDIAYYTSDAMGANMINMATERLCKFIAKEVKIEKYL